MFCFGWCTCCNLGYWHLQSSPKIIVLGPRWTQWITGRAFPSLSECPVNLISKLSNHSTYSNSIIQLGFLCWFADRLNQKFIFISWAGCSLASSHMPPNYLQHTVAVAAGTACDTVPIWEQKSPWPCQSLPPACLRSLLKLDFIGMQATFLVAGGVMST